ncbi:hypothetical protein [Moorena sp. SIO4G3]|uniref:hypothetical protein n=1 Tax=Moorena sp. SIO4G3 TaxID=2607821 RepID=UPI00142C9634|nr:hypothetical protein [Moorena sp. SIO4G3]NEO78901.1 hypothetical protein [Moorena sp. SIO4G3]
MQSASGGFPQDRNGAFSMMARDCSPSRVAPLHRFRRAIAYIELRLYEFLAFTPLQIINFISPSPHLPKLPTRPVRPLSSHFPHSLLPAPCSGDPLFPLLLTNDWT